MKIPKKVKIGGHWWTVKWPYKFQERTDYWGQTDDSLKEIRISIEDGAGNKRTLPNQIVTFLHELLHAIDYFTSSGVFIGTKEGEAITERIAECIYQILVDNGWLEVDIGGEE